MSKRIFLLCNAHLDPVWQWEWEEGAAEALSTFRIAADFCEEYEDFIFCHNEALLYRWIEEYDTALFRRIQDLVARGKWHVMGGWHLQPDCNMPSGEFFVRQILAGRQYFAAAFGKAPTVAVNVDPFGHTRGLVQIMAKSGYTGYLFMRPNANDLTLPAERFCWQGYDGSSVAAVRMKGGYSSPKGQAAEKARNYYDECPNNEDELCLWGIGNHGGGPSKKDLEDLSALIGEVAAAGDTMIHSTPEAYFATLDNKKLPPFAHSLQSWSPGCYTSQIRIKQTYRAAESTYCMTEAMAVHAALSAGMPFPRAELAEALYDINTVQFHDMLPGSSIQPAEEMSLRMLNHGQEVLSRVRARAFFALCADQPKSAEDTIPIFVYNPYPYAVEGDITAEFMLWDQNWNPEFLQPVVYSEEGVRCPAQCEKEHSTIPLEWRKRVVFHATLAPMCINRFACGFETLPQKPTPTAETDGNRYRLAGGGKTLLIDRESGCIAAYGDAERAYLKAGAGAIEVFDDNYDPWFMEAHAWKDKVGEFSLLTPEETAEFCCVDTPLEAVHVIESGDVRTVVEAVLGYRTSRAVIKYVFSADGTLDIQLRLLWNEKQKMARLYLPAA
ncbi:MAG: alpha-mannosidase, partial [Ruminococcaceae bacterium]|nr:alpha-mannosidase [Oscillospiraceae bacterium]